MVREASGARWGLAILALLAASILAAPALGNPGPKLPSPANPTIPANPAIPASLLSVSASGGALWFEARSSLHDFRGEALAFTGALDMAAGSGSLSVPVSALTTRLGARDERMRACLDAAAWPEIRYEVRAIGGDTAILARREGGGSLLLSGDLSVRGQARPVVVPARFAWEQAGLRLQGRVPLRWADHGVPDPSPLISVMAPEIAVVFDLMLSG